MGLLPLLKGQHPQCKGDNKHCFLFTTDANEEDKRFFPVKQLKSGKLQVEAGSLQGVVRGTEFQILTRGVVRLRLWRWDTLPQFGP